MQDCRKFCCVYRDLQIHAHRGTDTETDTNRYTNTLTRCHTSRARAYLQDFSNLSSHQMDADYFVIAGVDHHFHQPLAFMP